MRHLLKICIIEKFKSQSDFARACGKSDAWVSRIVTGRRGLLPKEKQFIASVLGVDAKDYLFREGTVGITLGHPNGQQMRHSG
jgi:transcriptional regulator with XRE-family HTH domain